MKRIVSLCFLLCLSTCIFAEEAMVKKGQAILMPFKKALKKELMDGLSQGLDKAIQSCSLKAPAITKLKTTKDIQVGRTSHKLRNAKNAPADWMKPLLKHYQEHPEDKAGKAVSLEDRRTGYAEPIFIKPLCLTCHGSPIPEEVQQKLKETYPKDQATGFKMDEFRGLFWTTFPED